MDNLYNERKYVMSLNVSQCYESSGTCSLHHTLFRDALIPKGVCDWSMDYNIKGVYIYIHVPCIGNTLNQRYNLSSLSNIVTK
jgi:hypothetical protein